MGDTILMEEEGGREKKGDAGPCLASAIYAYRLRGHLTSSDMWTGYHYIYPALLISIHISARKFNLCMYSTGQIFILVKCNLHVDNP